MSINTVLLAIIAGLLAVQTVHTFMAHTDEEPEHTHHTPTQNYSTNLNTPVSTDNSPFITEPGTVVTKSTTTAVEDNAPKTTVAFAESEYNFGNVFEGELVSHTYSFTNTGSNPLIISDAKGSCGCTVPSWPKEPILPGQTGSIDVEFNSKGKTGDQAKTVTITANTEPAITTLTIKGFVEADATSDVSPIQIGN